MEPSTSKTAERVLKRRKNMSGEVEYLVRWKDLPKEESSWVLERKCHCPDLIKRFEKKRKLEERKPDDKLISSRDKPAEDQPHDISERWCDIHEDAKIDIVVACAKMFNGNILYLIKWKGIELADLVTSQEARVKWPQEICKFLEKKFRLTDQTSDFNQNSL